MLSFSPWKKVFSHQQIITISIDRFNFVSKCFRKNTSFKSSNSRNYFCVKQPFFNFVPSIQYSKFAFELFCVHWLQIKSILHSLISEIVPGQLSWSSAYLQLGLGLFVFQLKAFSTESKMSKEPSNVAHDFNFSRLLQDKSWYDRVNSSPMIASLLATVWITSVFWSLTEFTEMSFGPSMICSNNDNLSLWWVVPVNANRKLWLFHV